MTSGFRLARAAYSAAVSPAGPDPMMTTLRSESDMGSWENSGLIAGSQRVAEGAGGRKLAADGPAWSFRARIDGARGASPPSPSARSYRRDRRPGPRSGRP